MPKKAAWLLPSLLEGSGGHRTILQNAQCLVENGYICDLYIEDNGQYKNIDRLKKKLEQFFGRTDCVVKLGFSINEEYDIIFATVWYSAVIVRDLKTTAKKAYFIQDFEAQFNPMGDGYLMAMSTYSYGLLPITIGRWLSLKMQSDYCMNSQFFDFCYDSDIYYPMNIPKENAVCFIYQPDKPRRCYRIGIEALALLKQLRPSVNIYLYGSSDRGNIGFEHENLGLISITDCNRLYNRCRVGLCMSSSNPSRIPFEMMATGLPVVDLFLDNNLYDMPDSAILLAHYTPESVARAIINILDNEALQLELSEGGKTFMRGKTLNYGYHQFLTSVENILSDKIPCANVIKPLYTKPPISTQFDSLKTEGVTLTRTEVYSRQHFREGLLDKIKCNRFFRNNRFARMVWNILKRLFGGVIT